MFIAKSITLRTVCGYGGYYRLTRPIDYAIWYADNPPHFYADIPEFNVHVSGETTQDVENEVEDRLQTFIDRHVFKTTPWPTHYPWEETLADTLRAMILVEPRVVSAGDGERESGTSSTSNEDQDQL